MCNDKLVRALVGGACLAGLLLVFLFQRTDVASLAGFEGKDVHRFLINRTIRFLANDFLMVGLIYALFRERKYVVFALWVQIVGMVFFLIPYFILKLRFPLYNGPLISYLHRLIMNPTLLLLLIPAFYYQRSQHRN